MEELISRDVSAMVLSLKASHLTAAHYHSSMVNFPRLSMKNRCETTTTNSSVRTEAHNPPSKSMTVAAAADSTSTPPSSWPVINNGNSRSPAGAICRVARGTRSLPCADVAFTCASSPSGPSATCRAASGTTSSRRRRRARLEPSGCRAAGSPPTRPPSAGGSTGCSTGCSTSRGC